MDLKAVLMNLGNKLVVEHGYDPATTPARPNMPSTHPIKAFTDFLNDSPEARVVLKDFGVSWPMVESKNGN